MGRVWGADAARADAGGGMTRPIPPARALGAMRGVVSVRGGAVGGSIIGQAGRAGNRGRRRGPLVMARR